MFKNLSQRLVVLAIVIALIFFAWIVASIGWPPQIGCGTERCKANQQWLSFSVTLLVLLAGLFQYQKAQAWKRAEWLAAETASFLGDKKMLNTLYMLDWSSRRLPLLVESPETKQTYFDYHQDMLLRALRTDKRVGFSEEELAIRDCFDHFLSRLERFEIFRSQGLVSFDELQPYLAYWMDLIGKDVDNRIKEPKTVRQLWRYISFYGFDRVVTLARRFGHKIAAPEADLC